MVEMTSSFELEIKSLDEDHQRLINLANKITDDIDKNKAAKCARQYFAAELLPC